jgi:enterochelin esterase-like enzyme
MHFPESPRFHVIAPEEVRPQSSAIAPRPIYVYLPEAAARDRRWRFPVLYCQDGQNLWDDPDCCFGHGGWYLNRIVDELTADNRIVPVIVVGIPNSAARYREYAPGKSFFDVESHAYARYVRDVVKPCVEKKFPVRRTRNDIALLGSSLGGLVSLWLAHSLPATFGKAACLSGAFQVRDRQRKSFADFLRHVRKSRLQIYLDCGTIDDGEIQTRKVRDVYVKRGWQDDLELKYWVEQSGEHNEVWWRKRVWRALVFMFGRS